MGHSAILILGFRTKHLPVILRGLGDGLGVLGLVQAAWSLEPDCLVPRIKWGTSSCFGGQRAMSQVRLGDPSGVWRVQLFGVLLLSSKLGATKHVSA